MSTTFCDLFFIYRMTDELWNPWVGNTFCFFKLNHIIQNGQHFSIIMLVYLLLFWSVWVLSIWRNWVRFLKSHLEVHLKAALPKMCHIYDGRRTKNWSCIVQVGKISQAMKPLWESAAWSSAEAKNSELQLHELCSNDHSLFFLMRLASPADEQKPDDAL